MFLIFLNFHNAFLREINFKQKKNKFHIYLGIIFIYAYTNGINFVFNGETKKSRGSRTHSRDLIKYERTHTRIFPLLPAETNKSRTTYFNIPFNGDETHQTTLTFNIPRKKKNTRTQTRQFMRAYA